MKRLLFFLLSTAVSGCTSLDSVSAQQATPVEFPTSLDARRVWSRSAPNFYAEAPSPDGRLLTDVDWSTGDLAVKDLESGEYRRVTDKGSWAESGDYAEWSVFAPDGQRIAYTWFDGRGGEYSVRTIALDGSDTRVLLPPREDIEYTQVEDWSTDGQWILVMVSRSDRTRQIGMLSAVDGTYRALKTNDWRSSRLASFSSDGRYVAYDLASAELDESGRSVYGIFLLSVDGSREVQLVNGGRLLGWLPDGSGILYQSLRSEPAGIWALRVEGGEALGPPELVRRRDSLVVPIGFSGDAYVYGALTAAQQLYVAPLDLEQGRMLSAPEPLVADSPQVTGGVSWSPDGQSLAYIHMRSARLIVGRATGEVQQEFLTGLSDLRAGMTRWTPDGSAVLLWGRDNRGRFGIHRVELGDGSVRPVVVRGPDEGLGPPHFDVSADGTLYYRLHRSVLPPESIIMAHDLSTDQARELLRVPPGRNVSVSPDGAWLALLQGGDTTPLRSVVIVPTSGGQPTELFQLPVEATLRNRATLEWTPDGQSLLLFGDQPDAPGGVWQIPTSGDTPTLLIPSEYFTQAASGAEVRPALLSTSWMPLQMRLSPDGTQIAYRAGENRGEYWMLTGFPPAPEPTGSN